VNGTTGEGLNLTVEERKIIVEEWKKVSKGRLTIVAQVGAGNVKETCDLAMHANRVGVDCIAVIPPTYYKPPTVESLVLYLEAVSKCVPNLPLYYYHIPKVTGIDCEFSLTAFPYLYTVHILFLIFYFQLQYYLTM
jgi:N-acetylneuraminate lyase